MLTVFSLSVLWEWYFLDAHPISLVLYDTLTKSKTTGSSTNYENMMTSNKNRSHEAPKVCLSKSCESYESGHQTVMSSLHITSIYCNVICRLTIRGLNPDSAVEWVSSYTSLPKWTKMVLQPIHSNFFFKPQYKQPQYSDYANHYYCSGFIHYGPKLLGRFQAWLWFFILFFIML